MARLRFWRAAALVAVGALILLLFFAARFSGKPQSSSPSVPHPAAKPTVQATNTLQPWGRLETETVFLERPDRLLQSVDEYFERETPWMIDASRVREFERLITTADLTEAQRVWLLDRKHWQSSASGFRIPLPDEMNLTLGPAARQQLYNFLAGSPDNLFKNDPFWVPTARAGSWLVDDELSEATRHLVGSLLYHRGGMTCFSDPRLLRQRIPTDERKPLLRVLTRVPVQRAFLTVKPGDDLDGIANYWNTGGRSRELFPLLRSIRQSDQYNRIDLSYLLPRFASTRLYTYPDPISDPDANRTDCFWSALNFLKPSPDRRFLNVDSRVSYIVENYEVVNDPRFGDVVVLLDQVNNGVHSCIHVAADLVFTKNGASTFTPWILMSYSDLMAYYTAGGELRIRYYRARQQPQS